ncbi:uncharacterized protein LOC127710940 [Mytilus californianus]|uniref:uncharacterized protein LOC127710940 n=1 Tax=Mytilus californianus TaxID=6549 RepID=UPI0022450F5F|nr:uncharacterized protein LOC127710940 [Mytilus californianus]
MFGYLFLLQIIGVVNSKTCYYYSSYYSYYSNLRSKYCLLGCCSSYSSSPCCSSSSSSYYKYDIDIYRTISTAETIGIVIGSLIALSIFISIITCICRRMRQGAQGQVLSQPTVAYITTTGSTAPSTNPQTAFQPTFGSNVNIMGSTEQLNVIPPNNGNTAYPPSTGNTVYPPNNGTTAYPPSYDNLAHDNVKGSESFMNACT